METIVLTYTSYDTNIMFNNVVGTDTGTATLWWESLTGIDLTVDYNLSSKFGFDPVIDRLGLEFSQENGIPGSYNRQIQISGSNDGDVWTPIAQEASPSTQTSRSFPFNNITPYKWYRFTFPSNQNFQLDGNPSNTLAVQEIFLFSDQGSVSANNFYGPLVGTASYATLALSASHMEGTASWAYSASQALFASESLVAISASYVSGVLTGSLYGTASWAVNTFSAR